MYGLKMASDIKAVRERLDAIRKDKEFFHLEVRSSEECFVRSRETDSCPPTIVVGREADKERIIQLLLNVDCGRSSSRNVTVAPIVGIGGLGKTTLAQLVFYDDQVKAHYEVKGWVYVSQSFDIRTILEKMLQSVTGESQADLSLDVMRGKLQEEIRGKRFLFALDDVWEDDVESWEALVKHLNVGSFGSNVLVTTRSREVADVASRVGGAALPPYLLQGLSLDESWNLMSKRVNCGEVLRNPDVERIGKEILMKCHGVPLAVATVAGLLGSRNPETEWSSFLRDEIWSISEERNPIMSTLRLSFEHLPSHLKHCFSYCKIFPKGHELCVPKLVQLWTAQGYIEQGYRGLECFKTLWCRSFFHEVEIDQFETGLELIRTSSMPLIRTMMMKMTTKEVAALSKLTYLDLRELNDLEYLPEEGVRNLGSLRVMVIVSCPRLGSLPRAMQELASLQKLKIERCPQLAERCREGLGEDWPNISQVTEIQLD
ncbi:Putative disease resistance protein RGA3 [Linum perenne]